MLSHELFPKVPVSATHVAASVSALNLVGPWLGVIPCCHGAGGLAAQASFGATTGAAPMLLGAAKLLAGLLFGSSLARLLQRFPASLLGVMLTVSGAELASTAARMGNDKRTWCVPGVAVVRKLVHVQALLSRCEVLCAAFLLMCAKLLPRGRPCFVLWPCCKSLHTDF